MKYTYLLEFTKRGVRGTSTFWSETANLTPSQAERELASVGNIAIVNKVALKP